MTRPTLRLFLTLLAIAVLLAAIFTLASGAWAPRVGAQPVAASAVRVVPDVSEPAYSGAIGTDLVGGLASWYEDPKHPRGYYAAAGPLLREALGDWRGQYVTVEGNGRSVTVVLSDFCACSERHGIPTIIDLSRDAFVELENPSRGLVRVSIEIDSPPHRDDERMRLEDQPLPATSTER